jgi:hypothetical protein
MPLNWVNLNSLVMSQIVLTGGFGDSQYLFDIVQEEYSGQNNIAIIRQKDVRYFCLFDFAKAARV